MYHQKYKHKNKCVCVCVIKALCSLLKCITEWRVDGHYGQDTGKYSTQQLHRKV